ncbi:STE3-domain-containing protein [Peniophora sp. CONT]|nr:STE3-domain-containing protein [Peniophora sp. CONT]
MVAAVDPSYPLYSIASILAAAMLLLVLLTSFIRQSWNLGVTFLCFWLFLENLTNGITTIIWADNGDVKLYVYCDIMTHLDVISSVVKPMATLIITRRLYLITSLRSVDLPDTRAKHWNTVIEWTLGLAIPIIVAGPFYYTVQSYRFYVFEGFGCVNSLDGSILSILLIWSWNVIPPLLSVIIYYPRVALLLYRQNQGINRFLKSNHSVSRANYFRILALASIDILFTLPVGIANIALAMTRILSIDPVLFYGGWTADHSDWEPSSQSYEVTVAEGASGLAQQYFAEWLSPVLAFVIFGLFGVTSEARTSYWRVIYSVGSWFGWKPAPHTDGARSTSGDIESGEQPLDTLLDSALRSRFTSQSVGSRTANQTVGGEQKLETGEPKSSSSANITIEAGQEVDNAALRDADHLKLNSKELVPAEGAM